MRISKLYNSVFGFLLLSMLVSACTESPREAKKRDSVGSIFGDTHESLFRGHQMGDTAEAIRKSEPENPIVNTDSLLQYHYFYNLESDSTEMDLFYTIDSYGLFEIQSDIHPKSKEGAKVITDKIASILNEKYGDYKRMGIVRRWTTNSPSNNIIEITLSNESEDSGEPFVSLNFLEPLPNEL